MTAEQFRKSAVKLFGSERGWQTRCAETLGVDQGTVSRYLSGTVPVPKSIEALMQCLAASANR